MSTIDTTQGPQEFKGKSTIFIQRSPIPDLNPIRLPRKIELNEK